MYFNRELRDRQYLKDISETGNAPLVGAVWGRISQLRADELEGVPNEDVVGVGAQDQITFKWSGSFFMTNIFIVDYTSVIPKKLKKAAWYNWFHKKGTFKVH